MSCAKNIDSLHGLHTQARNAENRVLLPAALVNFDTVSVRTGPILTMSNLSQPVLTWPVARTAARVLETHSLYKRAKGPALPGGFDSPAFRFSQALPFWPIANRSECPYNSQSYARSSGGSAGMAAPQVTEDAVNALLISGKLSVSGSHKWKRGDNKCWGKIEIPVTISDQSAK